MVTIKDLVEKLQTLDQDMPVYWGVDEEPCWRAKEDKTVDDFPMKIEPISMLDHEYYLYFGDYRDDLGFRRENNRLSSEHWDYVMEKRNRSKNIFRRIKDYIFGYDY